MCYPSTGYTALDLDVPKAIPSGNDLVQKEWTYKSPGFGGTFYGMSFRTPTGRSAGTTPEECATSVDTDVLAADLNDDQVNEVFAEGSVLCTLINQGSLAMVEITEVRGNGGRPDLFGEVTLWKAP
ncbi:hypothetical protein [Streptomyces prasinus]|uniref:hypothetical protein n=1 Tax=Streptomyces prasinus TaxID=67345 RepID=UPI0036B8E0BA